ncbi:MAG: hypothetical protein HY909_28720 [Deltaproteobacteria bacterium]|nr:hypothetical protein [Deltaproteobacteria bacterium]
MAQTTLELQAERLCLGPEGLQGTAVRVASPTVRLEASLATRDPAGSVRAEGVTVWPCRCVPVGFFAREARWDGGTAARLDGAGIALGGLRVPLFPRWWALWGDRAGLLGPRLEWRDGPVAGLGASVGWAEGSLSVYALGRGDGAELEATLAHARERVTLRARAGGASGASLRGSLGWRRGARVLALRADGATSERFGRSTGALPVERLRGAQSLALGTSVGDRGGFGSGVELVLRGDDLGARVLTTAWSPVWSAGGLSASARGGVGAWLGAEALAFTEGEARARWDAHAGPWHAELYARGAFFEARGPVAPRGAELARGGFVASVRPWRWLSLGVGAGGERDGTSARAVLEGTAEARLQGALGVLRASARGLASTDRSLPPRLEARVEHRARGFGLEGVAWWDASPARVRVTASWASARGHRVWARWTRLRVSPWDLVARWEDPSSGPLDLEGVRARRTAAETVAVSAQVALGGAWLLRGDVALDALGEALAWAGGAARWRARCGCAWVTASAFGVRGSELVALVALGLGEAP